MPAAPRSSRGHPMTSHSPVGPARPSLPAWTHCSFIHSRLNSGGIHAETWSHSSKPGLHAHRAARRHRDHRGPDRPVAPGRAGGPRGGPAHPAASTTSSRSAWRCTTTTTAMSVFPPGYVSSINTASADACNMDQENQNGVDLGAGWAWGSMILPYMEQQPLYNSINFNLSVAYPPERHVQPDGAEPSTSAPPTPAPRSSRSSRTRPTRPTPAATTRSHIVDTLVAGQLRRHVRPGRDLLAVQRPRFGEQ